MPKKIDFSEDGLRLLKKRLLELKARGAQPCYAAFDADGTLWDSDVGEDFFQFQIENCKLKAFDGIDPWVHYHHLKKQHPPTGFLWLAQINEGRSIDQIRGWARASCEMRPPRWFESQKKLIHWLSENDIIPIVVTASLKWAVEPAAEQLGIPKERVIGVQSKVNSDNNITTEQEGPITWRAGKVEGAKLLTGGKPPIFCVGNTLGDRDLLEYSCGLSMAVQSQSEHNNNENKLYRDEQDLLNIAIEKKWLTHSFI